MARLSAQSNVPVCVFCVLLNIILAAFQDSIGAALPQIVDLLKDNDRNVRATGANTLATLSEQGEIYLLCLVRVLLRSTAATFRAAFRATIPGIVDLLKDNDIVVHRAGAEILANLSEQGSIS